MKEGTDYGSIYEAILADLQRCVAHNASMRQRLDALSVPAEVRETIAGLLGAARREVAMSRVLQISTGDYLARLDAALAWPIAWSRSHDPPQPRHGVL